MTNNEVVSSRVPTPPITTQDVRVHLAKVLDSAPFQRSPRMQALLSFLVEETIAGRGAQLKEYVIGVAVFGKPNDFDPGTSAVVRVEAGRVRRLLAEYSDRHGTCDVLKLTIPKGRYVPSFEKVSCPIAADAHSGSIAATARSSDWISPAERRLITAISCSLRKMPGAPADAAYVEAYDAMHTLCGSIVEKIGGTLDGTASDRLVIYFNWPDPIEDGARRALTAALDITSASAEILEPMRYGIQIGVATGEAALRSPRSSASGTEVVGPAPALATKLLGQAPSNGTLVDDATRRLTGTSFDFVPVGGDISEEMDVAPTWRLLRARPQVTRFQSSQSASFGALVGRQEELELLTSRARLASEGEGQAVLVTGEPGMGKSRLVEALIARLIDEASVLRVQCSPHHRASALSPWLDFIRCRVGGAADAEASRLPITDFLSAHDLANEVNRALITDFLSTSWGKTFSTVTRSQQKDMTLDLLAKLVFAMAKGGMLLLLVEDVHWADPTSLELLHLLLEHTPDTKALLLMTSRPDPVTASLNETVITTVRLSRLPKGQALALLDLMPGSEALSEDVRAGILKRAAGTPLFLEELARLSLANDTARAEHVLPERIADVLTGQFARLGRSRGVAQVASVLGLSFTLDMLCAVAGDVADHLESNLDQLIAADLIVRQPVLDQTTRFVFRHALLRDAAYASLLPSARRQLHGRAAEAIVEVFPALAVQHPEVVAMHYTEADNHESAVPFWFDAGQKSAHDYALTEAAIHFRRVLKSLTSLPQTLARRHLELQTLISLGSVVRSVTGYADGELLTIYESARDLARDLERPEALAGATYGLWTYAAGRGEWPTAAHEARRFKSLIESIPDDGRLTVEAERLLGASAIFQGRFQDARAHFDAALATYDSDIHGPSFGVDPGAASHAYLSWTFWHLGERECARASADEALLLADLRQHPSTTAMVLSWLLVHAMCDRDMVKASALCARLQTVCVERECRYWQPFGAAALEWVRHQDDPQDRHLTRFLQHVGTFHERYLESYLRLLAAEMAGTLGKTALGFELLEEAQGVMKRYDERLWRVKSTLIEAVLAAEAPPDYRSIGGSLRDQV